MYLSHINISERHQLHHSDIVGRNRGSIARLSLARISSSGGWGEDCFPGVGNLGHESIRVVGRVGGRLDPPVGQGDRERASNVAPGVLGLGLFEVGVAVVVSDAVLVGVGLGRQLLLHVLDKRGLVGGRGAILWC